MSEAAQPAAGGKNSLPPGIKQAIHHAIAVELRPLVEQLTAVIEELRSDDSLANLQRREELERCKKRLMYAENKIKDLESALTAHMEVSARRQGDIESLRDELAEVAASVAFLKSVEDNRKSA